MITYHPLWITLAKKSMKKKDLYPILSSATVARMAKDDQSVSVNIVNKICTLLDCEVQDEIEYRKEPQL